MEQPLAHVYFLALLQTLIIKGYSPRELSLASDRVSKVIYVPCTLTTRAIFFYYNLICTIYFWIRFSKNNLSMNTLFT